MSFLYFAYGSNMFTNRLHERAPSAKFKDIAWLSRYCLTFHKASNDGSGKCTIQRSSSPEQRVMGVIFLIDESDKESLDNAEGPGYQRTLLTVQTTSGDIETIAYLAAETNSQLIPFHWYKKYVVAGARQHQLPDGYVRRIERTVSKEDSDCARADRHDKLIEREQHS